MTAPAAKRTGTVQVQKRGPDARFAEHIGMTRGGRNTKIYAVVDGLGNPLYVQLIGGQIGDITVAYDLLEHVDVSGSVVMADKAYGAADFRIKIGKSGASYCIPPKANTAEPWEADWWQYKESSRVECFFQKIKNYRRIATQYDKMAVRFLSFVHLVCILVWLM